MRNLTKLALLSAVALVVSGCDDDTVEIREVEKTVVVEKVITEVETVEVPVIVQVPHGNGPAVQVGSRPYFLVQDMEQSALKDQLQQCSEGPFYKTDFSIGHRGAPMQYPEHTKESYIAAARMGAGILECDVTFTKDKELVCRHSQCDLHTTTNILAIPELAAKCSVPFSAADPANGVAAQAQCCTSDITLAEFKQLTGKMDAANSKATTVDEYLNGTAAWRTDLYSSRGTLMTHAESIELFKQLGTKMTPELKSPSVDMPFDGFSQQDYAQKMLDEYKAAGVEAKDVWAQSFNLDDVKYWIDQEPEFGKQGVYLDDRYNDPNFNPVDASTWTPTMESLVNDNVKVIAPPLWVLVKVGDNNEIVPSEYALAAKAAGLKIITWTLERSGHLQNGGGWYYQSIAQITQRDGDQFKLLDVLYKDVGVLGVFADWPGTVSYYASCMNMAPSI